MKCVKDDFIFCAQACINSYRGTEGEVISIFDAEEFFEKTFSNFNIEGLLGFKNNVMYIVFQGSKDLNDWLSDFKFWQRKIPYDNPDTDIRVHDGFIDQYKMIRDFIHMKVINYFSPDTNQNKIIVTGHSLGAALATLCAVDIQYNFQDKITDLTCVTLGSPRVGNKAFSTSFNKRVPDSYRIINGSDLATKVPLRSTFSYLYSHVDTPVQVGKRPEWYQLVDKYWGDPSDHEPPKYLKNIKAM